MNNQDWPRIAIIGAGFSGLCLAIQLRTAGIHSFTVLEQSERVGGTWRDNTYPGAACDIPSFLYCFSFEPKPDWSRKWAPQAEILDYIDHCVHKYDLSPHIRLGVEVTGARYRDDDGTWCVHTSDGDIEADILVSGVGQLSRPFIPDIPGLDRFEAETFHSARWNHGFDVTAKTVGVVGNAASAIQFIPEIAPRVTNLYIFQRSANWMLPKGDRAFTPREHATLRRVPALARLYRSWLWLKHEARYPALRYSALASKPFTGLAMKHIRHSIADRQLQDLVTPDYPIGAKRVLVSDNYYHALQRPNVHIIPGVIDRMDRDAVIQGDDRYPVDALILATGFQTTAFLSPMEITGVRGQPLSQVWRHGAEAFLGITVAGFPNFFMTYGPNTNLGHHSFLFMLECQTTYIMDCIEQMIRRRLQSIDIRRDVMDAYNRGIQHALDRTVWAQVKHSWYRHENGRITNNWPGSTLAYWWHTRRANLDVYRQVSRSRTRV